MKKTMLFEVTANESTAYFVKGTKLNVVEETSTHYVIAGLPGFWSKEQFATKTVETPVLFVVIEVQVIVHVVLTEICIVF